MISGWKQELVKAQGRRSGELFARGNKAPAVADAQKVIDDLHRKIGHLTEKFFGTKFRAMQNRDLRPAGCREREQPHLLRSVPRAS